MITTTSACLYFTTQLHLTRVLTRKNAPPPGGHVFQPTAIIFELVQDIIGMNLLTYLGPETQFQKLVTVAEDKEEEPTFMSESKEGNSELLMVHGNNYSGCTVM
ncbi:hypothetical protein DPMN_169811 [Dreissena polymorpha]|uniref:Uncharacterized protein n=1 Tax=Dreissena polymorpha TaxID=45954 RepID=A0A9D4DBF5_DREPO|nr:hypothetical protein DPMN_048765 [Dreissena polymorpha]KAH3768594.1 hypothetical protein DPMN_169811 [Dreissena polymorpha]